MNNDWQTDGMIAGAAFGIAKGAKVYNQTGDSRLAMQAGAALGFLIMVLVIFVPAFLLGIGLLSVSGDDQTGGNPDAVPVDNSGVVTFALILIVLSVGFTWLAVWNYKRTQRMIKSSQVDRYELPQP